MLAAASRLIAIFRPRRGAEQGPGTPGLPLASPRSHGSLMAVAGLFAAAGAWILLTEFGEGFAAQICYRYGVAPDTPRWFGPVLGWVYAGALLICLAGVAAAWRSWRSVRGKPPGPVRSISDSSIGRQRYVAKAALLLSLLFLVGLAAAGLAVLLVSPCSALR